jgi:fatty-acyl-CoA synthase
MTVRAKPGSGRAAARRAELDRRYPSWEPHSIPSRFAQAACANPDSPLIISETGSFSYAQMDAWSRRLASGLVACGVKAGDHVALIMGNYAEFVAAKLAILRAGAVTIPVNFYLRGDELSYVLFQSEATVLITMDRYRGHDYLADLDSFAPGWQIGNSAKLPALRHAFGFSPTGDLRSGVRSLDELEACSTPASDKELTARALQIGAGDVCDILYTSGTTGRPKGVLLTHDMILRAAYASVYTRAFEDGWRIAHALPMYHVFGYIECLIAVMYVGGCVIPQAVFNAEGLVESAERHRAMDLIAVPTMTVQVLDVVRGRRFTSDSLVAVFNSGGVNRPQVWSEIRALLGPRELATGYGMTETTASTVCTLPEDDDSHLETSNGRLKPAGAAGDPAIGGYTAVYKTIDPETGADLPVGATGELVAKGPIVTRGYYKKPEETAASFTADGWLKTGDVGRIDAEGFLTLTGRIKETYRCGGEMVIPREIEELVDQHPAVAQALAVGVPDPKMGEIGCLCIVPRAGARPDPAELLALCSEKLARFKVPRLVLFFEASEIPLTATGRPQKLRLAAIVRERLERRA